jgi:OmpW family
MAMMNTANQNGRRHRAGTGLTTVMILLALLLSSSAARADFEFPRLSLGMGYGFGGIYHKDYVADTYEGTHFGGNSAGLWWAELNCAYPSRLMLGCRIHLLRVDLEQDGALGTFDIMPAVLHVGYYHPFAENKMLGFVGVGAGIGWTNFREGDRADDWVSRDGGAVKLTESNPFVFEVDMGLGYRLNEDFLIESHVTSVLMNTDVYYITRPDPDDQSTFRPEYAHEALGRHLMATIGLRWWFELW